MIRASYFLPLILLAISASGNAQEVRYSESKEFYRYPAVREREHSATEEDLVKQYRNYRIIKLEPPVNLRNDPRVKWASAESVDISLHIKLGAELITDTCATKRGAQSPFYVTGIQVEKLIPRKDEENLDVPVLFKVTVPQDWRKRIVKKVDNFFCGAGMQRSFSTAEAGRFSSGVLDSHRLDSYASDTSVGMPMNGSHFLLIPRGIDMHADLNYILTVESTVRIPSRAVKNPY